MPTRAATLLQSSGVAYRYGVSGPFWYASGATVQILLFATLAIELKRKAPNAHTFLVSTISCPIDFPDQRFNKSFFFLSRKSSVHAMVL